MIQRFVLCTLFLATTAQAMNTQEKMAALLATPKSKTKPTASKTKPVSSSSLQVSKDSTISTKKRKISLSQESSSLTLSQQIDIEEQIDTENVTSSSSPSKAKKNQAGITIQEKLVICITKILLNHSSSVVLN